MRRQPLFAILLLGAAACSRAPKHAGPPVFQDYPVERYSGPIAPPQFYDHAPAEYRPAVPPIMAAGPTFAGEIAVAIIPCGAGCAWPVFANVRTGQVVVDSLFRAFCFNYDFRPTSQLMIAHPVSLVPGSPRGDCRDVTRYLRWDGTKLTLVLEVPGSS